jgi:hypothetical protein
MHTIDAGTTELRGADSPRRHRAEPGLDLESSLRERIARRDQSR